MRRTALALIVTGALAGSASAEVYLLTVENLGPQPLSPMFYSTSNVNFNIFSVGSGSSPGMKMLAENGDATGMLGIATAAGSDVFDFGTTDGGVILPGETRTVSFEADPTHSYFSFASMLGKTNDGYIGESVNSMVLDLYSGGTPTALSYTVYGSRAWDAGTELNTQNAADLIAFGNFGNPDEEVGMTHVRMHGGIIAGTGDSWDQLPNWNVATPLARLEISPAPEPATVLALSLGAAAIWSRKRRKAK
jgi:hypothetical protein